MSDHGYGDTNGWFTWGISSERGLGILLAEEDATYLYVVAGSKPLD